MMKNTTTKKKFDRDDGDEDKINVKEEQHIAMRLRRYLTVSLQTRSNKYTIYISVCWTVVSEIVSATSP